MSYHSRTRKRQSALAARRNMNSHRTGTVYVNFAELANHERIGCDYRILKALRESRIAVMAPHGGNIEPGTSELAQAIAGLEHSFYAFEGIKASGNGVLHITSTRFDEPQALALAARSHLALTIHGHSGRESLVYIGGLADQTRQEITTSLEKTGFLVAHDSRCAGIRPSNLCNRCRTGAGVQIELTKVLRKGMFRDLSPEGRMFAHREAFNQFATAVRLALANCLPAYTQLHGD